MACNDVCCPPHNFTATVDPTENDCDESVLPGYVGGYCPGSYWYNNTTGVLWIGANAMTCGSANWINLNPAPRYHLQLELSSIQQFDSLAVPEHGYTVEGNKIDYDIIQNEDPSGSWNNGTNKLTVPENGFYFISAGIAIEETTMDSPVNATVNGVDFVNSEIALAIVQNGVRVRRFVQFSAEQAYATNLPNLSGSTSIYLLAGDEVYINLVHTLGKYINTNSAFPTWARGFLAIDQLV